jgi:predicted ATPase/DNA-binding SARP family transcriptional activator
MGTDVPCCQIKLFGPPTILVDGEVRTGLRSKSTALLAYLAAEDRPISRDSLATLLWPQSGQSEARQNLRTCLHEITHALPDGAVVTEGDTVGLNPQAIQSDVKNMRSIVATGENAEDILCSCPGNFMEGFTLRDCRDYDAWQLATGETLRLQVSSLLERSIEDRLARKNPEGAIALCQRLITLDPLEEASHRLMMRVCAACGRWSAAERQYRACRSILASELDTMPEEETARLAELVARRNPSLYFAPRSHWSSAPEEVNRFYGRDAEIRRIEELLASDKTRLLTLTGPAGAGKTRLAVRMAHRLAAGYPEGVAFVDLTRAKSADEVIPLVGAAIGIRDQMSSEQNATQVLTRHVDGRRMLLILDNFDHVLAAAAHIGRLLYYTRLVKIITTSREPLRSSGEVLIPVPPLEVAQSVDTTVIAESPATQLFIDRARRVDPDFKMTAGNCSAVCAICTALDGLPLSLELATPLLRIYSVEELASRLAHPLNYLNTGSEDRPERHRSLERAIDWSYDLLSPEQRWLFASLSIFANGFDLPAVEAVCGAARPELPIHRPFRVLLEKNLVNQRDTALGPRFGFLESTRDYAAKKACREPGLEALRASHADYYHRFALGAEPELHKSSQARWTGVLALAQGNLTAALSCHEQNSQWETGLKTANALTWFWYQSGQFGLGCRWLDVFLSGADRTPSALRARAVHSKGWLTFLLGNWRAAHTLYADSLYISRQAADPVCECLALSDLGVTERWLGNRSLGWQFTLNAVTMARELDDPAHLSRALVWAYATTGGVFLDKPPVAELEEAAVLARRCGDEWLFAHAFNGLGDLFCELGQHQRARDAYENSLEGFKRLGDRYLSAWNLEGLGRVELLEGKHTGAMVRSGEALVLFDGLGDELNVAIMLARIVSIAHPQAAETALAEIAGAASALLEHLSYRRLSDAPQVAEAIQCLQGFESEYPIHWLKGQKLSRAEAVTFVWRLISQFTGE